MFSNGSLMSIQISHLNFTLWHAAITLTHPFSHLIVISFSACSKMELCTPAVFLISVTGNSVLHLVQAPNFEINFDSSFLSPYIQSSNSTASRIVYTLKTFPGSDHFPLFLLTWASRSQQVYCTSPLLFSASIHAPLPNPFNTVEWRIMFKCEPAHNTLLLQVCFLVSKNPNSGSGLQGPTWSSSALSFSAPHSFFSSHPGFIAFPQTHHEHIVCQGIWTWTCCWTCALLPHHLHAFAQMSFSFVILYGVTPPPTLPEDTPCVSSLLYFSP